MSELEMNEAIDEVIQKFKEHRDVMWKENIKARILSGQHARRNKEIYLAKIDGKSRKELAKAYNLHPQTISAICQRYEIFLEENEMPDFDNTVFDGENGTTTLSELKVAKGVLEMVGRRMFYEKYDIRHALPASVRIKNALSNANWITLAAIERESDASLMRLPNFGKKSFRELRQAVRKIKEELGIEGVSDKLIKETQQKIKELLHAFGEERGREILSETWAQVRDENRAELRRDIREIIESIAPDKAPFSMSRTGENNLYEWNTNGIQNDAN